MSRGIQDSANSDESSVKRLCEQLLDQQPQAQVLLERLLSRPAGRKEGNAFAAIRMGRCSACHLNVAAVRLQQAKSGEFINCASCARFLYFETR